MLCINNYDICLFIPNTSKPTFELQKPKKNTNFIMTTAYLLAKKVAKFNQTVKSKKF